MDQPRLFTTTSLEKKGKRKNQQEIVRGQHMKEKWGKKSENEKRQDSVYEKIRTQKEWDVVGHGGSLFTLQDLWRPAYAVWHGSYRLLAGGSNIISSLSAHCAVECPAKKCMAAEYQENPLTFSPTTAVFIWVTAQKGLSLITVVLLSPAGSKRSQPTWLSHHIWACYRLKEFFFPCSATDLWERQYFLRSFHRNKTR